MKRDYNLKIYVTRLYKGKPSRIRLEWYNGNFLCEMDNKQAKNLASKILNAQKVVRL